MSAQEEIKEKILSQNEVERILISEFIYDSLDKPDADVEAKWVDESEKRYQAYKEGKVRGISINKIKFRDKK